MKDDKIEISEAFVPDNSRKFSLYYKGDVDLDRCPFREKQKCRIDKNIKCNFGLSGNNVPEECPLKKGKMLLTVSLREAE